MKNTNKLIIIGVVFSVLFVFAYAGTNLSVADAYTIIQTQNQTQTQTQTQTQNQTQTQTQTQTPVPNLTVSCSVSPNPANVNQSVNFSASASGGTGSYIYNWSGTCTNFIETSPTCSKTFNSPGTYTSTISVTSGTQNQHADCSVNVTQTPPPPPPPPPSLTVSCSANPSAIQTGQSSTFIAAPSGGTNSYTYSWSGTDGLSGSGLSISKSYSTSGRKDARVTVISGTQNQHADCSVNVNQVACSYNYQCGTNGITGGLFCQGNNIYQHYTTWTCNNPGTASSSCSSSITDQLQTNCTANQTCSNGSCINSCTPNYQQRCIGNSMYWYDSCGNQSYAGVCGVVNNTTLTLTKTVRNLTNGTGFANSTYANPSDVLMFMITLQANGNQDVQNVFVRDMLPANLIYNNQLVVARNNNTYSNYSGDIMSGLSLNTISAGQTATITYQARVAGVQNFSYGTTTLNNSVSATSSAQGYTPTASASVVVTRSTVLGASTVSTGLTNNFWVDSFFLPLLMTFILIWMWRTRMFFGIEKWLGNKKKVRMGYKSEKELSARIAAIQKFGKV